MRWIVGLCVRYHGTVATLTVLALVFGSLRAAQAPLDVFPEFVPSQVAIQTEAPGFAAEQVEQLVTRPIESLVNGSSGLATLRSESIPGLSVVTITFADNIDLHVARQGIAERLTELGSTLPQGVATPKLSPLVSSTMDLLKIGLRSETQDPYALRDAAEWTIKPRLLAVPGVAHVIVFGGAVRQIQVLPDPRKLASYSIALSDVADAARAALALRGAGFIDLKSQRVLVNSPTPQPDLTRLSQALVTVRNGMPIRLGDVAQIEFGSALKSGDALIMGHPGVLLSLASQYGANTLETTRLVERALADLMPVLQAQGIAVYPRMHRPANFIERALGDMEQSLLVAALMILAVLYLFLRDVRAALIAFTAIPLSLIVAVMVLSRGGQTLNTMTLGGFAVALGVLVDDAIIGIENILRRLRTNAALPEPQARLWVICEASLEVRGPVIYATAVVIAVFLPELFTTSVQGHFVGPLAFAFVLAVLASLLVAVTAAPALCALFFRRQDSRPEAHWLTRLKAWQWQSVTWIEARLRRIAIGLGLLIAAALAVLPFVGGTFMPDFREGHFVMQVSSAAPGTSLQEMIGLGERISDEVLKLPYVATVAQQIGRAELSEDTWGPHRSELHVELKADTSVDQSSAQEALRAILNHYPGTQSEVVTFLGDRIGESLSGETAQVAIRIFGPDLDQLDAIGNRVVAVLSGEPGVVDLQFKRQSGTPTLSMELLPGALVSAGLRGQDVLDAVQSAYAGAELGQTFSGNRTVNTVLRMPDALRGRPEKLGALLISGPLGPVPLATVARIKVSEDRYSIEHDSGQRRISVTFNVSGRSLQDTVTEARQRIGAGVKLPPATYVEFKGAAAAERQTRNELLQYSLLALVLILMLLSMAFRRQINAWLVLINLPFCLIGSVIAIAASGVGLSLGTTVGLVTVFGVSARNAILQLAHYEQLVDVEGLPWNLHTVLRGANERLVPILMTAAVTALGLAPLAIGFHRPGQEIEGPMAITVLGGLATSTLLNLLVLPALAYRFVPSLRSTRSGARQSDSARPPGGQE
jgi:CzcA family heavy metal efflux pump